MKTTCTRLYGNAPTLDDMEKLIQDFYCGTKITLSATGRNQWSIANSIRTLPGVRVLLKAGRYRFESTAPVPEN